MVFFLFLKKRGHSFFFILGTKRNTVSRTTYIESRDNTKLNVWG